MAVLPHHLPWFIVGPLIGLVPVTLYGVANRPLGASGAYLQAVLAARGRATVAGCCGLRPTCILTV